MLPIPGYLLEQGVRDMVRISDARMSGTSYGCLRAARGARGVSSAARWPWSQTGDLITLDVGGPRTIP